jgi:hypothetical protein
MRQALLGAGFPNWQADGLIEDYAHYRHGEASDVTSAVQEVIGRAPRSFAQFARLCTRALLSVRSAAIVDPAGAP